MNMCLQIRMPRIVVFFRFLPSWRASCTMASTTTRRVFRTWMVLSSPWDYSLVTVPLHWQLVWAEIQLGSHSISPLIFPRAQWFRCKSMTTNQFKNWQFLHFHTDRNNIVWLLFPQGITVELNLFFREHQSGIYRVDTYYLTYVLVEVSTFPLHLRIL